MAQEDGPLDHDATPVRAVRLPFTRSRVEFEERRDRSPARRRREGLVDIVLMGPPGVGKGTQAAMLAVRTGLTHVASGDLFRMNIRDETELGLLAKAFVDRGELVPDRIVIDMVLDRMLGQDGADGTLLDGFPRTLRQARTVSARLAASGPPRRSIDAVVLLTTPRQTLLRRIVGRQTCRICQFPYNIFYSPSRVEAVCDLCGGDLHTRSDDNMETARHRLDVYEQQTRPVADYYRDTSAVFEVDGAGEPDEVADRIYAALDTRFASDQIGVP
jgi:adenylate kinase